MNTSDFCKVCGDQKAVLVTTTDGQQNTWYPGSAIYLPSAIIARVECACTDCGLLYSLSSLTTPVEFHE